ncbi:MAG: DNA polymerase III subunit alpha, partial [Candidatus Omnitrophica bacterium]|nr:DNA polymerase III subunit alpha [Candidatus Omnitrophota bacterium]
MPSNFVHLHTHTEFSLLSSTCRMKDMVERAAELKMPAIAITDHGNLFAAIDFYEFCTRKGIKPILGCDVFVAPKSRLDRSTGGVKNASYPLVLLAETDAGYRNLIKLVSSGYLEGFYYKPRIDKTILREMKDGLIALSGGISSEIPNLINIGQYEKAKETAKFYSDLFGPDHFYLEIQRSHLRDQEKVNEGLIRISKEIGVPVVATSNVMYMDKSDIQALETMYSIQAQTTMLDEGRPRVYNHDNYFKTTEEMCQQFEDLPDAVENTLKIAERCNVTIDFKTVHLPHFETPDNLSVKDYLRKLTYDGAKWRYGDLNQEVSERIEHELNVISNLGYDSYFLIVWDFVRFARDNGIPVGPGRGSAAGSVVSYCLGITNLDPIRYDLLFER